MQVKGEKFSIFTFYFLFLWLNNRDDEIYRNHTGALRLDALSGASRPAMLGGRPVIQRVYEQVAGVLDDAVVATDDERIYDNRARFRRPGRDDLAGPRKRHRPSPGSLSQTGQDLRRGGQCAGRRTFCPGLAAGSRETLLRRSGDSTSPRWSGLSPRRTVSKPSKIPTPRKWCSTRSRAPSTSRVR